MSAEDIPFPYMPDDPTALTKCAGRIYPAYIDYVQHVSPNYMAMGLRSCAYILWLAEQMQPASAIDYGSGLTSYVLRSVCDNVWTVDDQPEWLDKTATFLKRYKVSTDNMVAWDDYRTQDHDHDFVVYDFSSGDVRNDNFAFALEQLTPEGVAVFDDAQHDEHRMAMWDAAEKYDRNMYLLGSWTMDEFHRYAALITARQP